jgi:hypothetical protein
MNNMIRELRVVWNCAFALHYKGMFRYLLRFLVSLLAIVPIATWYLTKDVHRAIGSTVGPSLAIFFCIWITLPSGVIRQNTAANARLVPHLYNRLILLTALTALTGVTVNAFFLTFFYGHFGWCFVSLLFYAVGMGWGQLRQFGWPIALVTVMHRIIIDNLPRDLAATLTSDNALIIWLMLGLLMGAAFLKSIFPRGGDRSWRILKDAQRQATQTNDPFAISKDAGTLALAPYIRALRVACAKRSENLAMLTLGPNSHWGALLAPSLVVVIGIAILKISLLIFPGSQSSDFFKGFGWGMAASILIVMQLAAQNTAVQFSNTKAEQSLYRLGAYAPSISMLNQKLAWGIVRAKLEGFFLMLVVALGCSVVMGVSPDKMIAECALCCMTLPFICLHLRDYSREAMMDTGYARIWQLLGILILAPVAIFLLVVPTPLSAWVTLAVACIVSSAVLIGYRWRNMVRSPVVFPAGRIAA